MEAISTTEMFKAKISGLRAIKRGLVFATVISGGIMAGNLIKTVKNNNVNKETTPTEVVSESKQQNPAHLPYVSGTLFTLGLLGAVGANSARKKTEKKLDEYEANELHLPLDIYQAIKYVPEIKNAGLSHSYENTLSHALRMHPAQIAPVIEQIIDFWKEKYKLNIIEEEKEPELKRLLKEAANHTNGMAERLDALKNRQPLSDIFVEKLYDTFYNGLKYPGIDWRGSRYLETGKVNTDKVLVNGCV